MAEYSKLQELYMERVAASVRDGWYLSTGITYEEAKATFEDYIEMCKDKLDDLCEGDDMPTFEDFYEWRTKRHEAAEAEGEFSWSTCDCCGSHIGGTRYACTALPPNPAENKDFCTYWVCTDCYLYIANGDVPDDENLTWLE